MNEIVLAFLCWWINYPPELKLSKHKIEFSVFTNKNEKLNYKEICK